MSILEASSGAEISPVLIEEALESVLRGPSFRSSKQCQALLQYIVKHTLSEQTNMLRERVIGAEVFGRARDYDTGNDPIVRSRAAEVRKRLAQHYVHEEESQSSVRIDIPSGSYHATFEMRQPRTARIEMESPSVQPAEAPIETRSFVSFAPVRDEQAKSVPVRRWTGWKLALTAISVLLLAGIGIFWSNNVQREGAFNRFWGPVGDSSKPVVVYFGGNYSYHMSSDFLDAYRTAHPGEKDGPQVTDAIQKSGDILTESSLVPDNPKTGYGDVAAVARVVSTLTHLGSRYDLRYGSDIAATDFRNSATILIGGFSNVWSMQLMHGFPFVLGQGGIVDGQRQTVLWRQSSGGGEKNEDYAVISRIPNAATGNFTLIIAGINTFSNQAAADFIASPERLRAVAGSMKPGWENRNLQIVLHVSVIRQVPLTSDVVAVRSW